MATVAQTNTPLAATTEKPAQKKAKAVISPGISLISGGVAGAVEATATYPFEFAKTRAQLHRAVGGSRNPFAVIAQVAKQDGVTAIYTGCSTLIIGTAFKAGVRFLSFDSIRNLLADQDGKLSPGRGILAGMAAGCVESVVAVTPTERIKTALIDDARSAGTKRYNGGFHALRTIVAERGFKEVYRGLASTTMKQAATSATRMGSYNILKEAVAARRKGKATSATMDQLVTFATGAAAGTVTVYVTQPFDTIKTRAQGATGQSTMEALGSVWKDSGVKGFWSGSTMRLGRLVLSGGIVFSVYENVAALLSGVKK